jgi:hypothetical protein
MIGHRSGQTGLLDRIAVWHASSMPLFAFVCKSRAEHVDRKNRRRIGQQIVEGYRRMPQADSEVGDIDQAAIDLVNNEPW